MSAAAASGDGGAPGAGEVISIGTGKTTFDDPELTQAGEVSGEGGGEHWARSGRRSARRRPAMLKAGR